MSGVNRFAVVVVALLTIIEPAHAQWVVYDPTNFTQNVLTAARELKQIDNEVQGLANQAQMLVNQAKNLASLPYSSLAALQQSIQQTQQLLTQAQSIAYDVTAIDHAFSQIYPQSYSDSISAQRMIADAGTRWQNARAGYQDSMRVEAGVVQNLETTRQQVAALVSSSQQASGALEVAQSGNQLAALETSQLADLTAVIAAMGRAQNLDGARTAESQAQAQQQLSNFLNGGQEYEPLSVTVFH